MSACIWSRYSCESCKFKQSWFLPPTAVNRPEFRQPTGAPLPPLHSFNLFLLRFLCSVLCSLRCPTSPYSNPQNLTCSCSQFDLLLNLKVLPAALWLRNYLKWFNNTCAHTYFFSTQFSCNIKLVASILHAVVDSSSSEYRALQLL